MPAKGQERPELRAVERTDPAPARRQYLSSEQLVEFDVAEEPLPVYAFQQALDVRALNRRGSWDRSYGSDRQAYLERVRGQAAGLAGRLDEAEEVFARLLRSAEGLREQEHLRLVERC